MAAKEQANIGGSFNWIVHFEEQGLFMTILIAWNSGLE